MIPRGQPGRRSADLKLWAWVVRGWLVRSSGPESRGPGVSSFGPVGGAASLCSRCGPTRGFWCGRPAGVSGVGPQSANLGAGNRASGELWGCLSSVHCPGAKGGGAPEAAAASETSLISH